MIKDFAGFSGVVLAGGRSSRMGFPKELLSLRGRRVIDIILEIFKSLFDEIFIVTDDKNRLAPLEITKRQDKKTRFLTGLADFKDAKVIEDLVKGYGPLAGIYTGLKSISKDKAFFVACDMPFLHIGLINRLLAASRKGDYSCIIPYSDKGIEPLHAVYSKSILADLEESLSKGELSVKQLLRHCNCKYVKSRKEEASSFFNINTPEDIRVIFSSKIGQIEKHY